MPFGARARLRSTNPASERQHHRDSFHLSDNGGVSSGDAYRRRTSPLRGGKGPGMGGGIREPYYISRYPKRWTAPRGPRHENSRKMPVTGADLYPTLLDLAGLPLKPNHTRRCTFARHCSPGKDDPRATQTLVDLAIRTSDKPSGEPSS